MVKIEQDGEYIYFTGHTMPHICASISSIMYTTINALAKYDEKCINFEDDGIKAEITILRHDYIIDILINNMFDMFRDLQEDGNEKNIELVRS